MRKNYYILVFTFLSLLLGQNSLAQTSNGDFEYDEEELHDFLEDLFGREISSYGTDPDTGYVISVQGPGEGGGHQFGFVGFETSSDGSITASWGGFVDPAATSSPPSQGTDLSPSDSSWSGFIDWSTAYSFSIPYDPIGDCWGCGAGNGGEGGNDVASNDNNPYIDTMPDWVKTNYLAYVADLEPPTSSLPSSYNYSGNPGDVIVKYNAGTPWEIDWNYGPVPIEEVNDVRELVINHGLYHVQILEFVREHPGSGLKLLKAFTANYPDGDVGQFLKDYFEPKNLCIEYPLTCGADNTVNIDSNTINKKVLTQAELTGLIQNMVGDYTVSVKHDYIGTTSSDFYGNTKTYKGRITRLYNNTTMHSYYYFMPYKNFGDIFHAENTHYKMQEPLGNVIYPPASPSLDADGMPKNYQLVNTKEGPTGFFFGENNSQTKGYCENCTKIENNNDPKYPQLSKVLPKIKSLVLGNPVMLQHMITFSGYNRQQIINLLSVPNLKKLVRVSDIKGAWGLYEKNVTPDIIFIRADLVASLETGGFKDNETNQNLKDTSFFAAMVIIHELIHYGRHMNNLPQLVDGIYEAGEIFETWVFGGILGVNGVTNLATQYGWTF